MPSAAQSAQPREDMLADDRIHVTRIEVLEAVPAEILVVSASCCPCPRERSASASASFSRLAFSSSAVSSSSRRLRKSKVGDLLNDFKGVGDPARPEGIPDLVDLIANFTSKHGLFWDLVSITFPPCLNQEDRFDNIAMLGKPGKKQDYRTIV